MQQNIRYYLFQRYLCTNKEFLTFLKKVKLNLRFRVLVASQRRTFWSRIAPGSTLNGLPCFSVNVKAYSYKTAKHYILSINLAIIFKYILGKVFQFDVTEWRLAKCCTIWLYKQHSYSPSFFKIPKAKHLTYFLCLSKRNFPELRKRRNSVDCRQPHWSLYLQTSYGCERTTEFPLTWLPTQLSILRVIPRKKRE